MMPFETIDAARQWWMKTGRKPASFRLIGGSGRRVVSFVYRDPKKNPEGPRNRVITSLRTLPVWYARTLTSVQFRQRKRT